MNVDIAYAIGQLAEASAYLAQMVGHLGRSEGAEAAAALHMATDAISRTRDALDRLAEAARIVDEQEHNYNEGIRRGLERR